jgi:hypothetical protein
MDLIIVLFVLPELIIITVGFLMVICSLAGNGDFQKLIPGWRPNTKAVPPAYWGNYTTSNREAASEKLAVALPRIIKRREYEAGDFTWDDDKPANPMKLKNPIKLDKK